jgi:hypothetical protein
MDRCWGGGRGLQGGDVRRSLRRLRRTYGRLGVCLSRQATEGCYGWLLKMSRVFLTFFPFAPRAARLYGMCNVLPACAICVHRQKGRFPTCLSPPPKGSPRKREPCNRAPLSSLSLALLLTFSEIPQLTRVRVRCLTERAKCASPPLIKRKNSDGRSLTLGLRLLQDLRVDLTKLFACS